MIQLQLLRSASPSLPVNVHMVKYEAIVANREQSCTRCSISSASTGTTMCWTQATALGRGRIKTASYAQVAQPIFWRSSGRWRHYRAHLDPILPVLKPWIEKSDTRFEVDSARDRKADAATAAGNLRDAEECCSRPAKRRPTMFSCCSGSPPCNARLDVRRSRSQRFIGP